MSVTSAKLSMCCKCGMPIGAAHSISVGDRIYHIECNAYAAVAAKDARIEALEAENARLVKEVEQTSEFFPAHNRFMEKVWAAIGGPDETREHGQDLLFRIQEVVARLTAAEADREALREALARVWAQDGEFCVEWAGRVAISFDEDGASYATCDGDKWTGGKFNLAKDPTAAANEINAALAALALLPRQDRLSGKGEG